MPDQTTEPAHPAASPARNHDEVPVPRLGSAAGETAEDSLDAERAAVGDGSDTGGPTPPDHAQ